MKILKDAATFEILTPPEELGAQLLRIERAGRICYQSQEEVTLETAQKFIAMLLRRGHESVIEHSQMVVKFSNVSRGFTHEIVRHRLASFSQESTRYVDYTGQIHCIVPPHRDEAEMVELKDGRQMSLEDMFCEVELFYQALRQAGWPPEDARQILPIGIRSQIVVSANFREWRHIFFVRTQRAAHWEIRTVMCALLDEVRNTIPVVFNDLTKKGS